MPGLMKNLDKVIRGSFEEENQMFHEFSVHIPHLVTFDIKKVNNSGCFLNQ